MKTLYFALFLMLNCAILSANNIDLRFNNLTIKDGLASTTIWDLEQDKDGFIWFATSAGIARFDGYKITQYSHSNEQFNSLSDNDVRSLHLDQRNDLWIGTLNGGLNKLNSESFLHYQHQAKNTSSISSNQVLAITSNSQGVWIGTKNGVSFKPYQSNTIERYLYSMDEENQHNVQSLLFTKQGQLIVGTNNQVGILDINSNSLIDLVQLPTAKKYRSLHQDETDIIWIGTNDSLHKYNPHTDKVTDLSKFVNHATILDITSHNKSIWLGTYGHGIYKIDELGSITNYAPDKSSNHSLSDKNALSLLIDTSDTLWVGTFNNGANYHDIHSSNFGLHNNNRVSISCLTNQVVYSLFEKNNSLWIGTEDGAFQYNIEKKSCLHYSSKENSNNALSHNIVFNFYQTSENYLWVSTARGLNKLNLITNQIEQLKDEVPASPTYFATSVEESTLLLGTRNGLYEYQPALRSSTKIDSIPNDITVHNFSQGQDKKLYFATNKGLYILNANKKLRPLSPEGHASLNNAIESVYIDQKNNIYIGNSSNIITKFTSQGEHLTDYYLTEGKPSFFVVSDIIADEDTLWVSTNQGLYHFNLHNKKSKKYTRDDGLQGDVFIRGSAFKTSDNQLLFGGRNGFNRFSSKGITVNQQAPKLALTNLTRLGRTIKANHEVDGFSIQAPINQLQVLNLSYKDYVFGVEFSALHFANFAQNRYAYKLEGLVDNWTFLEPGQNKVNFTNLPSGDYKFRVKAANKNGQWSNQEQSLLLPIKVKPAPWLTWWAYSIYGIVLLASIIAIIHYRTQTAIQRARVLKQEVAARTKEINTQKNVIENLLARKNELFANISHEFRTPLNLILGPLEKIQHNLVASQDLRYLSMIQRNANRLLNMVEQILKLTELQKEQSNKKYPYALKPSLLAIVESFQAPAQAKDISLTYQKIDEVTLLTAADTIEIVIGNLLSNAIKYTAKGGQITLDTDIDGAQVLISIKDNGLGISPQQHEKIFERFVRLEQTSDIEGTGIGLSIVKELLKNNRGNIKLTSKQGEGSTFTVSLPITELPALEKSNELSSINHLAQIIEPNQQTIVNTETAGDNSSRILIIDDNLDMLEFIKDTLKNDYHCLTSDRGTKGIEIAIELIPDLIICDIMMPGIDGYEVSRRIRAHEVTCHIPLILLTAKGDKASRIQGWRDDIDDYMTKPFDQEELKLRISNLLSIRNILKRKTGSQLVIEQQTKQQELCQLDQLFIDKLKTLIQENYSTAGYNRVALASAMAVSERQLQRKVKALINHNPMELLKEYRLTKAVEALAQGHQVGVIADMCGFKSVSHFSQCFKAFYGVSPKNYKKEN